MQRFSTVAAVAALALSSCAGPVNQSAVVPNTTSQDAIGAGHTGFAFGSPDAKAVALPAFADANAYAEFTTHTDGKKTFVVSGPLGEAPVECGTQSGKGGYTLPNVRSPYVTTQSAASDKYATSVSHGVGEVVSTSTLTGVSILKGAIRAGRVVGIATSKSSPTNGTSVAGGSFSDLVIDGHKIGPQPKPNTTMTLRGYGVVVLNRVIGPVNNEQSSNGVQTNVQVNMVTVNVTEPKNPLKVPVGTTIVVGSAYSAFTIPPAPYAPATASYSLLAIGYGNKVSDESGPWDGAGVACNSDNSQNFERARSTVFGALGTMNNVASANPQTSATATDAVSDTKSASLLAGLIVADGVHVTAAIDRSGSAFTNSGGTTFDSLTINGKSLSMPVAANTRIDVKDLGYIMVNEQNISAVPNGMTEEVNAVHLYVTAHKNGFVPGGELILGHAHAQISPVVLDAK